MTRFLSSAIMALVTAAASAAPPDDKFTRFFDRVKPILDSRCVSCHGPDKQKAELRLDSREALLKGGDSGPALVPGAPDQSLLVLAARHAEGVSAMPPKEKLTDKQIADLAAWIKDGAVWPGPARVLFEDEAEILQALPPAESGGAGRIETGDTYAGKSALALTGQLVAPQVAGWAFRIRAKPAPGEYRYIRFAWKKAGGAAMFEVAADGNWRAQNSKNGAWIAGPNTSGWNAHAVAEAAPGQWTAVTRDLWADGGSWRDFTLTGLCVTAIDGGELLLDSVILGRTRESLEAYAPGRGIPSLTAAVSTARRGDAWSDPENPVVKAFKGERLDLWSWKKPARPGLPAVADSKWARTPVDRFILAKLEAAGLKPSPEADRRTLVRRLKFDLLGLPPTPEEADAFAADPSPDAYAKLAERFLASPHYGERWGRHWLDVVRYADTNGFERDEWKPDMWRYRDYVIRAFNADVPYDRFVREQLAGDELLSGEPKTAAEADRLIATGFLRLGPWDSTGTLFEEDKRGRDELMSDLANTTGAAFLGMTLACCQCHDHKYDPLLQADHYRFRAFFAGVRTDDRRIVDPAPAAERIRRNHAALAWLEGEKAKLLAPAGKLNADEYRKNLPEAIRAILDIAPEKRDAQQKKAVKSYVALLEREERDEKKARAKLGEADRTAFDRIEADIAAEKRNRLEYARACVMTDGGKSAPATRLQYQGDFAQMREEVPIGFPSALDPNPAEAVQVPGATTGRRLALANWIASKDNPWTARTMVNRLWLHHFGRGIAATPNDFGFSGSRPTHPELLDWLAAEFAENGWSVKAMHRTMVLSATYRQASVENAAGRKLDPDNRLFGRQNPRRLDAETLRDSLLATAGQLLPNAGGPPRWPSVPEDILKGEPSILESIKKDDEGRLQGWYTSPPEAVNVRSVYLIQKRLLPVPFLRPFDLPENAVSCGCRNVTTVAPQALTLLNSPEAAAMAKGFAERVAKGGGDQAERAFRLALSRPPDDAERKLIVELLRRHAGDYAKDGKPAPERRALADLCRALMNLNEFAYID